MEPKTKRRKQTETHSSDIADSQPLSLKRLCKDCHWNVVRKTLQELRFIDAISKAGRGFCNRLPTTIITVTDRQTIMKTANDIEALGCIRDALDRSLDPSLLKQFIRVLRLKEIDKMQHADIIEQCFHDEIVKHKCCEKCLTEGEDQTQGQCPDVDKDTMQDVQDYLIRKYKKDELSITKPIPGEEFMVPLDETNIMRPKFTAEEIDFENRKNKQYIASFGKLEKAIYKNIDICELEMMFESVGKIDKKIGNVQENLICLVGDPGVGKTTVAQWFTLGWAKGEGLKRYKLVFFIPIRSIGHETLLKDILFRLELLPTEQFDWFQVVQNNADAVLFLLDGVDEFDIPDDVDRLIKGEVFSDSTVAITARPEAKYFMSLSLLPRVKVSLFGTDEDTVARYLRAAVSPSSDAEWTDFQDRYKEKLHDESLLCVPLYLTLLCTVFREHIVSGIKCANLKVPESATQLFNIFLKVLLDRWRARSCPDKKLDISFERSPLDSESKVPSHMKTFLNFIGRLCFYDLSNSDSHYQFTDKEIRDYLLDSQIIKDSGFFNIGKSGDDEIFFLKHKQLQEYLAAVYLSFEGTKEFRFNEILYSEENKGKSLALVMRDYGLIKVVEFACGLSGKFLTDVFQALPSQSSVMRSSFGQIDIYYEAALFIEQNAGNLSAMVGFNELMNHLGCSIIKTVMVKEFNFLLGETTKTAQGFYQKCLRKLTSLIDINMSTNILSWFYQLIISFPNQAYEANQAHEQVTVTLCLDQLQTELLSMFCLKDVKSVESVNCNTDNFPPCYVNLPALLETFPDLESLHMSGTQYIPYSSDKRSGWEMGSSVKSVYIWNYSSPIILPDSHVTSLLKQRTLTKLILGYVSPLTTLGVLIEAGQSPWPLLNDFTLSIDLETLPGDPVDTVTHLVNQHSDTFKRFRLSLENVKSNSVPQIEKALQSLRRLHRLDLFIKLSHDASSSVNVEVAKNVIPHLTSLETLEVMHTEDSLLLPELVEAVYSHRGIQTLIFSLWSDEPDAQFPENLKRKLHERQVKIFWGRDGNLTEIM